MVREGYTDGTPVDGIDPQDAVCVLEAGAPPVQWHACRSTGIGGSDVSGVLGMSRYKSRFDVWSEKVQPQYEETPDNSPAWWGHRLEPILREETAERRGVTIVVPGTLRSSRWPWMMTNLDGLCSDGMIFEAKTLSSYGASDWEDDQVADHAELQAQHNMAVSGTRGCYVAALIGGQDLQIRYVERDEGLINHLVEIEREFWERYVLTEVMPPADATGAFGKALERAFGQAQEGERVVSADTMSWIATLRDEASAAATYAKYADQLADNTVRQLLGEKTDLVYFDPDGRRVVVATNKQNGNVSAKKFAESDPEEYAKYVRSQEVFDLSAFKEEDPEGYEARRGRRLLIKKDF